MLDNIAFKFYRQNKGSDMNLIKRLAKEYSADGTVKSGKLVFKEKQQPALIKPIVRFNRLQTELDRQTQIRLRHRRLARPRHRPRSHLRRHRLCQHRNRQHRPYRKARKQPDRGPKTRQSPLVQTQPTGRQSQSQPARQPGPGQQTGAKTQRLHLPTPMAAYSTSKKPATPSAQQATKPAWNAPTTCRHHPPYDPSRQDTETTPLQSSAAQNHPGSHPHQTAEQPATTQPGKPPMALQNKIKTIIASRGSSPH